VHDTLVVPKRALMHGAEGEFVWIVGQGGKVEARPVRLGLSSANDVAISSGLSAGDRVIVEGILKVQPGAAVDAAAAAPGAAQ
jgi:membrane fusion protein (multidrug efflux system)